MSKIDYAPFEPTDAPEPNLDTDDDHAADYTEIYTNCFRFAFRRIGSLIREGIYDTFPEECPECGADVHVRNYGDRIECWGERGLDDCGWHETRCHDCGVTPNAMFTYTVNGDLLNPECVQHRGHPL